MGYWEFLLQKEGDQSWLPLDTAQVEILEGRYRIMAHTSLANAPVKVQISQLRQSLTAPGVKGDRTPKRRTLRRQTVTNDNGLMVVMPFTRLGEGTWDILCASAELEASAAPAEATWRYAVQLRVVAQDSDDEGDWFADDGSTGIVTSGAGATSGAGVASTPEVSSAPLDTQALAIALDEFQRQLADGLDNDTPPYALTLHQTALLGSEGESLGLPATVAGPISAATPSPLALVVRLSDPQTAAAVALTATPLAIATLPAEVTLAVAVPAGLETRLLLGEVGLLAGSAVVALQGFTVTVDVASLFNAIANQAEADTDLGVIFPGEEADDSPSPAPLKPLDLAGEAAPPRAMPILTLPRSSPALPPKIYYPSPHEVTARRPALPLVGQTKPIDLSRESGSEPQEEVDAKPEPPRGLSLPPLDTPPRTSDPVAILSGRSPAPAPASPSPGRSPQLISHEAMGFRELNLQDRFWNRLNELAVTLQQEAQDNQAAAPEAAVEAAVTETAPAFIPFAGEVVIYADEDPTLKDLEIAPAVTVEAPEAEAASDPVTPPVPQLVLPEGDLTAGDPVLVLLRVPFHPNRLYLKVWITDPQTRTLADEPRQLMNLMPNGQGQLEGSLQLTAPLGCLEAWFEAISIDMVTQQESYKASVSRTIIPTGLSSSSLDEFQL